MQKLISVIVILVIFSGCSIATLELIYRDTRVVYQDAKYVIHEFKDIEEGK